jgi:prepilin-type processing-associated H-X9-DG protein
MCPSDDVGHYSYLNGTRSSYVACFSADGTWIEPGALQPGHAQYDPGFNDPTINPTVTSGKRALFNANVHRGVRDVTDGTSNTMALSECITGPSGGADQRGIWWINAGVHYTALFTPNSGFDMVWKAYTGYGCDTTKAPCNYNSPYYTTEAFAARSRHTGGVNVAFADGSVHFISNNISLATWQALASVSSGEVINGSQF